MKTRPLMFLFFLFFLIGKVNAQSIHHSIGGTISVMGSKGETITPGFLGYSIIKQYNFIMSKYELTYFPKVNFETGGNSSLSVGIPLSLGIGSASDANKENKGVYFSYDLPLIADLNIGMGSTEENEKQFGYFIGVGFGYSHVSLSLISGSEKISSYGPIIHGGFRFKMGNTSNIVIGLFFKPGLESNKYKTGGIQVLTDL